jgi:hypothetical protein
MSLALTTAALGLAAVPSAASAQDFGTDEPALDEYVESLPIAEGNRPAGHKGRSAPLPRSTQRALEDTPQGRLLERVATSPAVGAPSASKSSSNGDEDGASAQAAPADRPVRPKDVADASLASAVVDSGAGNLGLLALLAAVPLAIVAGRRIGARR